MRRLHGRNLWHRNTRDLPHAESSVVCVVTIDAGLSAPSPASAVATTPAHPVCTAATVAADPADVATRALSTPAVAATVAAAVADATAVIRHPLHWGTAGPGDVTQGSRGPAASGPQAVPTNWRPAIAGARRMQMIESPFGSPPSLWTGPSLPGLGWYPVPFSMAPPGVAVGKTCGSPTGR